MQEIELTGIRREGTGKGTARKIRRQGLIPAVIYGIGDPISITIDPRKLNKILEGGDNTIFQFNIEGEKRSDRNVIVKELQHDPVKGGILHVDLLHIHMDRVIRVQVPITVTGEARGVVMDGGILHLQKRELEIECLPDRIPDEISVDITRLGVGDAVHVKDLQVGDGIQVLDDLDEPVISVTVMAAEEAAAVEEGGEAPPETEKAEGEPEEKPEE